MSGQTKADPAQSEQAHDSYEVRALKKDLGRYTNTIVHLNKRVKALETDLENAIEEKDAAATKASDVPSAELNELKSQNERLLEENRRLRDSIETLKAREKVYINKLKRFH